MDGSKRKKKIKAKKGANPIQFDSERRSQMLFFAGTADGISVCSISEGVTQPGIWLGHVIGITELGYLISRPTTESHCYLTVARAALSWSGDGTMDAAMS